MTDAWFYVSNGRSEEPETTSRLLELIQAGLINRQTPVWRQGIQDWQPLEHALSLPINSPPPVPENWKSAGSASAIRSAIFSRQQTSNEKLPSNSAPVESKKRSNWLLWWKIDPAELDKQVNGYSSLKFFHAARGVAAFCLIFSATITSALAAFGVLGLDSSAYIDAALFLILALFIYLGHRWAMIGAMLLWTAEKVLIIADGLGPNHSGGGLALGQVIWWAIYMHAFYLAFRVEQSRKKLQQQPAFQ